MVGKKRKAQASTTFLNFTIECFCAHILKLDDEEDSQKLLETTKGEKVGGGVSMSWRNEKAKSSKQNV